MKLKLQSEGVKNSDIKTLEQRLFLVRLYRNTNDPEGRLGFIEGAEHYKDTLKQIGNRKHDSYESSLLYALRLNIEELEINKEGEF